MGVFHTLSSLTTQFPSMKANDNPNLFHVLLETLYSCTSIHIFLHIHILSQVVTLCSAPCFHIFHTFWRKSQICVKRAASFFFKRLIEFSYMCATIIYVISSLLMEIQMVFQSFAFISWCCSKDLHTDIILHMCQNIFRKNS